MTDPTKSYAKLAKKYGIAVSTIANRARSEKWVTEKEEMQSKLQQKTIIKTIENSSETFAQVNLRHISMARLLQDEGLNALNNRDVKPNSAKDVKEFIVNGVTLERKALGLDVKEKNNTISIQNNMMTMTDFMKAMYKRQQERELVNESRQRN